MTKISALPADSAPTSNDFIPMLDSDTSTTKKVLVSDLALGLYGVWETFTPSFTNFSIGNGTIVGRCCRIGKTLMFRVQIVLGTTSAFNVGNADTLMTLPYTTESAGYTQYLSNLGQVLYRDNGANSYSGYIAWYSTTSVVFQEMVVSGSSVVSDNVDIDEPFSWGNLDSMHIQGTVELA